MEHKNAIETLAAERYLLDEMTEEENSAFEEHFFDCRDCADAVRNGATFIDSGKELVREDGPNAEYQPKAKNETGVAWKTWLPNAAAVSFAAILTYQNLFTIPRLTAERETNAASVTYVRLSVGARAGASDNVATLRRGEVTALSFDINPETPFPSYRWRLLDGSGAVKGAEDVSTEKASEPISVALPSSLPAGSYVLVVEGVREDGNRSEITRIPFVVRKQ